MLSGLLASLGIGGALAAIAAFLGPGLIAGGPIGLLIAWLGAKAASKTVKIVAIGAGLALLVGSSMAIVVKFEHGIQAEHELSIVKAALAHERSGRAAIEAMLGCPARPIAAERELGACIIAQRNDALAIQAAQARADLKAALAEQQRLDKEQADDGAQRAAADQAIDLALPSDDGPVPKVLRDAWARERERRGLK